MPKKDQAVNLPNSTGRNMAVNALGAFRQYEKRIQESLDEAFGAADKLDGRDRRLATELASGACRHMITLDHLLAKHTNRPLRKIHPVAVDILRVAVYQLLYLTRTPDFAAVHEAVEQGRQTKVTGIHSFINAVLRSIQRSIAETGVPQPKQLGQAILPIGPGQAIRFNDNCLPNPKNNLPKHLSVAYAHPLWLVKRWLSQYDLETTVRICLAGNARPSLTLRVNRLRAQPEALAETLAVAGFETQLTGHSLQLTTGARPQELPGYDEGLFSVQDLTAAQVASRLAPNPGERILDMCAAPGGKTTHLAELLNNQGQIIASDVEPRKLALIEENCRRLGINSIQTCLADELEALTEELGFFDAALLDVPCSNTGVLAKRVEARHLIKPATIGQLTLLQAEILDKAAGLLGPKGRILYSTCSIDAAENERQIASFLKRHSDFELLMEQLTLPSVAVEPSLRVPGDATAEREWPAETIPRATTPGETPAPPPTQMTHDGGYVALLQRQ